MLTLLLAHLATAGCPDAAWSPPPDGLPLKAEAQAVRIGPHGLPAVLLRGERVLTWADECWSLHPASGSFPLEQVDWAVPDGEGGLWIRGHLEGTFHPGFTNDWDDSEDWYEDGPLAWAHWRGGAWTVHEAIPPELDAPVRPLGMRNVDIIDSEERAGISWLLRRKAHTQRRRAGGSGETFRLLEITRLEEGQARTWGAGHISAVTGLWVQGDTGWATHASLRSQDVVSALHLGAGVVTHDGRGGISRYDGRRWQDATPPLDPRQELNDLLAFGGEEVWVVGSDASVLHWQGERWDLVRAPTGSDIYAIDGTSPDSLWAVGSFGEALHLAGETWTPLRTETDAALYEVWALDADHAWAVGEKGLALALSPGGAELLEPPLPEAPGRAWLHLRAVHGSSAQDAWIGGGLRYEGGQVQPLLLHWDGRAWEDRSATLPEGTTAVQSLLALSAEEVWVGCGGGRVLRGDGRTWEVLPLGAAGTALVLRPDGERVWAGTTEGLAVWASR